MDMKWSIENLEKLRDWSMSFKKGDDIKIPDFLSFVSITKYQDILKEKQGELLYNGHFTDEVRDEAVKELSNY